MSPLLLSVALPPLDEQELKRSAGDAESPYTGSRNLGGYGLAIMEAGDVGAAIYYGPAVAGHAHYDKPFMEVYGFGKKLIPDLGYPQFAAEAKDPAAWEEHNLSHYTVTVNASKQASQKRGILNQFAVTPDVRLVDLSAPDAYPGMDEYRRVTLMIGGESESPYMVDFFLVKGGKSHDFSIHGFDGEFATDGIELSPVQEKGTLAGEDVPYSYLYDDPELEKPDKTRSFFSYQGSAYSYLYNVQRGMPTDTWSAVWADKDCGIRAIFPRQGIKEAVIANGNPPKRPGSPESLKYILLRNSGDDGLASRFACVLQPFRTGEEPLRVRRIRDCFLEIKGPHGTDLVYLADDPSKTVRIGGLSITGTCAILRADTSHEVKSVFLSGGGSIHQGLLSVDAGPSQEGRVAAVDYSKNMVTLDMPSLPEGLQSDTILFGRSNYPLRLADERTMIDLGEDSPRIGKIAVSSIDPEGRFVATSNVLYFISAGCYENVWLVNEDFTKWHRITNISDGKALLKEPADLKSEFADKDGDGRITAYLYDVAPGQEFTIPAACWIGNGASGWEMQTNSPAKAFLPDGNELEAK